jgi:deazaflavin-dependent oxidoreductase (nitroreductase family)
MSAANTHHRAGQGRPLLGLRRTPGRLAAAFFRLPLKAYEHNAGPAVGRTFLAFTHVGRRTGRPHRTVAMVLRHDAATGEAVIVSAWGPQTDWYRNLRAHPAVQVQLGGRTFVPEQRFLGEEESFEAAVQFRREHPHRLRFFSSVLGWGDLRDDARLRGFVRGHPFVAFRPAEAPAPPERQPPGRRPR